MAGYFLAGAATVSVSCRVYHGSLYIIARRRLDSKPDDEYTWSDCMDSMKSRGYTATNTAIPAGAKAVSDLYLGYLVGSKLVQQLRHILQEYVYPAMNWLDDLVRGIPSAAQKTFQRLFTKLSAWYEHIKHMELGEAWQAMKKDLQEFLKYVGIGIGTGAAPIDWAKVWSLLKNSVQSLAYKVGDCLWKLCNVLMILLTDSSIAVGGYLYRWWRTEVAVVMLQFGYLAYLVREKYQKEAQLN